MGSIVSTGVGSGLDVAGLVRKLVEAEGAPKTVRLNTEEARIQGKLSALGSLRAALSSFRDTVGVLKNLDNFRGRQVALSSPDFLTATATATAAPGAYSIEVQQLAQAHKLRSATYPSTTTVVGTGTLTLTIDDQIFDVEIDADSSSLAGIAEAIKASPANEKMTATLVAGVGGSARLILSAKATGAASEIVVTQTGGDGGLAALDYDPEAPPNGLTELQAAQDAQVLIDGFAATSTTNTIGAAIAGVEFQLLAENEPGGTTDLTVGYDRDGARKTLDKLVTSYNALVDAIKNVASFNPETRQSGPLFGDAGVRNIVYQLRRELTANVGGLDGPFDMLGEVGITAQLDGKLSLNSTQLDAAFAADFDAIGELFSAQDTGVAVRLDKLLEPYLQSGGTFDSRNASLKSSIEDLGDQRAALNQRLLALQQRYTKQFNALDGLLAQLQGTSNFLSQQLSRLPGVVLFDRN